MAVVRWRPVGQGLEPWVGARELGDIQSEVNRLFDSFFGRPVQGPSLERSWAPTADMYETKDELVIKVDLPGMSEKDVQVSITGDLLSLKGQRSEAEGVKPEQYFRAERWTGRVERVFQLPIPVQTDRVHASYREGVLTVTLPKVEAVKPKEIKIDVQ
ncbi:MAG TPA: Hsp20/alpha crystallin family protein [Candidatus Bathyarchaeia archaeon]|nr:Hsp20/alpha crystallin family protein [Candidatus Bathyarchaeia archaeon]